MSTIRITRAGPLATLQDAGRFGVLRHGISASGPMDRAAFERTAAWIGGAGATGIEFTSAGLSLIVEAGTLAASCDGGDFALRFNGKASPWPARLTLTPGDVLDIGPAAAGNYGYLRFDHELDLPPVLGSRSTNLVAGLGGLDGRALRPGDLLRFGARVARAMPLHPRAATIAEGPIRVVWGLHADLFPSVLRQRFAAERFTVSPRLDRMGVRLADPSGVFAGERKLSLVSDAIVPGDIQILGDGSPIVLMRDHQPTGGYPRIATLASADFDRFAQLRPGAEVRFTPVTVAHAQDLTR